LCVLLNDISAVPHPHLLYPQFKQVAHPSMITSALVLHLWHMVALGGKLVPSPVTATSSSRAAAGVPPETAALTSLARSSYCLRFSAIRAFWWALSSGSWIRPMDFMCSSTTAPISATREGMYTPPALKLPPRGSNTAFISSTRKVTSPLLRNTADMMRVRATIHWKWSIDLELMNTSNGRRSSCSVPALSTMSLMVTYMACSTSGDLIL